MNKTKTHKGLKKRFRLTATGKVVHHPAGASHLLSHKKSKRKRKLRRPAVVHPAAARRLKEVMVP